MITIRYDTLRNQACELFESDDLRNIFMSMVIGHERDVFPNICSNRSFERLVLHLGATFMYLSKDDIQAKREPNVMILCKLPMDDGLAIIDKNKGFRPYMMVKSMLKFCKTLVPAEPL